MKNIFTYPENSENGWYASADDREYMKEVVRGDYKTNTFTATPAGESGVSADFSKYLRYFDERRSSTNLSRYDFWLNPVIVANVDYLTAVNLRLVNPQILRDNTGGAARFSRDDLQPHGFRDGHNIYVSSGSNEMPSYNNTHAVVKVIDATYFELYQDATYNDDGTVDAFGSLVNPYDFLGFKRYGPSPQFGGRKLNRLYDTRPYAVQSLTRGLDTLKSQSDTHLDYLGGDFSSDWDTTDADWMATLKCCLKDYLSRPDNEDAWVMCLDDEWLSVHDEKYSTTSTGKVPGARNDGNFPTYTQTFSYSWSIGENNRVKFIEADHGLVNGDPVNVTGLRQIKLTANGRELARGGCGMLWFVDRIDDDSFYLTLKPYRTRTDESYAIYNASSGDSYSWDTDTVGSTALSGVDIRPGTNQNDNDFKIDILNNFYRFSDPDTVTWWNGTDYTGTYLQDDNLTFASSSREPLPYIVSSVTLRWPGNHTYASGGDLTTTRWYPAGINDGGVRGSYPEVQVLNWGKGQNNAGVENKAQEVAPEVTFTIDGSGHIDSVSLVSGGRLGWNYRHNNPSGSFDGGDNEQNSPYTDILYIPPTPTTTILGADDGNTGIGRQTSVGVFANQSWDYGTGSDTPYNNTDAEFFWPDNVAPRTATMTLSQPSSVSMSMSGVKYVRSTGYAKYQLELEYPAMTEQQFAPFLAAVIGARGQFRPFKFPLRFLNRFADQQSNRAAPNSHNGILFQNPHAPNSAGHQPRLYQAATGGDTALYLEGFDSDMTPAIYAGQHLYLDGSTRNGGLNMCVVSQESNSRGQVVAKLSHPLNISTSIPVGTVVYDNPNYCIATLNEDDFVYKTDYTGLYSLSVVLTLDEAK